MSARLLGYLPACAHTLSADPSPPSPSPSCCSKAGFYSKDVRAATCSACPIGFQCPLLATKAPTQCRRGYFSNKEGAKLCSPCPINTYASGLGASKCVPCAAGTNTRGLAGQSACQAVRTKTLRLSMF